MKKHLACYVLVLFATGMGSVHAQWQLGGNANASGNSLLGTTNGVPLRIGTNNQERIRVAINGNVGINNTNPAGKLTVQGSGGVPIASWVSAGTPIFSGFGETTVGNSDFILSMASNTPLARGVFFGRRARGVLNAPLAVQPNDYLTSILASGYDGTNFLSPAAVDFFVDGPVSGGVVPGRISFSTGTSGGTRLERLKIGSNGDVTINSGQFFINQSLNRVGMGTVTPDAQLNVIGADAASINSVNLFNGVIDRIAVKGRSVNAPGYGYGAQFEGGWYGVFGSANATTYTGDAIGIYGVATGSAGSRYGLYGLASGGTFNAAGYFVGAVYANSYNTVSDRKFKSDIKPMKDVMSSLMKLRATTYEFKGDEYKHMNLPKGKQLGLIADEVKAVFPELVTASVQPAEYDKDRNKTRDEIKYDAVNYTGLIPVLIAAVQEQQKAIEKRDELVNTLQDKLEQQAVQIQELKAMMLRMDGNGRANSPGALGMATPNPAKGTAAIAYIVPDGARRAQLLVTDMSGRQIKLVQLQGAGVYQLDVSALSSAVYNYALIVDGKTLATQKMTVTR